AIERFVADLQQGQAAISDDEKLGRARSLAASLGYGFESAFDDEERARLAILHLFHGFVQARVVRVLGIQEGVPELAGLGGDEIAALLDRAAEIGLLKAFGDGDYTIHPVLPWYFSRLFARYYGEPGEPAAERAIEAYAEAMGMAGNAWHRQVEQGEREFSGIL